MPKTQLLLLDDHTLFRVMLSRLLDTETDFRVVAHCSAIQEALDVLGSQPVDLVLLDYELGNKQNGFISYEEHVSPATGTVFSSLLRA